jgi:hypothetical protein
VRRDGRPPTSVAAFQKGEEELQRAVAVVQSKSGHRRTFTGHVAVAGELTAHGAAQGGVV